MARNSTRKGGPHGAETRAVREITRGIREGTYAPGSRLTETGLAHELGLSRNTIREALRLVASAGLIEYESNRGARVRRLDRQEVANFFQVREVIEGLAANLAASTVNNRGNRDRIAAMLQEINQERQKQTPASHQEHNARFHDLVADLSENALLKRVATNIQFPALRPKFFALMDEAAHQRALHDHEEILHAILDGDSRKAEELMRDHVRRAAQAVHRLSDDVFASVYGLDAPPGNGGSRKRASPRRARGRRKAV